MLRPTAQIEISIDKSAYTKEVAEELHRSFTYVAPTAIRTHETPENPTQAEHIFALPIKLNKPYWFSSDEGADATWSEIMVPWIGPKLYKAESAIRAYNESDHATGAQAVNYGHLELPMQDVVVSIELPEDSSFPQVVELLERYRALLNQGALKGLAIERVEMLRDADQDDSASENSYAAWKVTCEDGTKRIIDSLLGSWMD
ncbi:MAG: hypothetical protein HGA54_07130 [Actinobacteria bacterium]|nr:hypothetical protein [Actinomycetota bacterium]